jgi:hypothetical protein
VTLKQEENRFCLHFTPLSLIITTDGGEAKGLLTFSLARGNHMTGASGALFDGLNGETNYRN